MVSGFTRSEQVIDAFKRHKLSLSVFRQIRRVIEGFEKDARTDRQIAEIGIAVLLITTGLVVYLMRII